MIVETFTNKFGVGLRVENDKKCAAKRCSAILHQVLSSEKKHIKRFDALDLGTRGDHHERDLPTGHETHFDIAKVSREQFCIQVLLPEGHRLVVPHENWVGDSRNTPLGTYYVKVGIYSDSKVSSKKWYKIEWIDNRANIEEVIEEK